MLGGGADAQEQCGRPSSVVKCSRLTDEATPAFVFGLVDRSPGRLFG